MTPALQNLGWRKLQELVCGKQEENGDRTEQSRGRMKGAQAMKDKCREEPSLELPLGFCFHLQSSHSSLQVIYSKNMTMGHQTNLALSLPFKMHTVRLETLPTRYMANFLLFWILCDNKSPSIRD